MTRILVTGGAGFIGSYCVECLVAAGHEVVVYDCKPPAEAQNLAAVWNQIQYVSADIRDVTILNEVMRTCTHVLHLAAVVSVPEAEKNPHDTFGTNVTGTFNVFQVAADCQVKRVVYASSAAVYGDPVELPAREGQESIPLSHYGMHKLHNEHLAKWYGDAFALPMVGLRFFNVYGARQDPASPYSGVISKFVDCYVRGQSPTIFGDGSATRDFVFVDDVARVCVTLLLTSSTSRIYNVGTGRPCRIDELVTTLNKVCNVHIEPHYQLARAGDILYSCADVSRLANEHALSEWTALEYGLRSLVDSIKST